MCECSMGLIISRPCRQNRWCQSCVRGWLPHWDHNRSSWNTPVELSLTGVFHDDRVRRTNNRYLQLPMLSRVSSQFVSSPCRAQSSNAIISEISPRDGKSGINVCSRLFFVMELLNIASLSRRTFHLIYECILS